MLTFKDLNTLRTSSLLILKMSVSLSSGRSIFGSVKEPKESLCPSVCPFGTKCFKALNIHLSLIGQSHVSLGSVSGQSQVSLRSVSGQSQVSLRSVSGQSQVSHRSLCAYFVRQTEPKILRLVDLSIGFLYSLLIAKESAMASACSESLRCLMLSTSGVSLLLSTLRSIFRFLYHPLGFDFFRWLTFLL